MRFVRAPRRRSWAWRGAFSVALLMICAYVFFDILDVDGSQMAGRPANAIIAPETLQVEADRFFRADPFIFDSTGLFSLSRCFSTETHRLSPAKTILRVRLSRMIPRVNPHRDMTCVSPSSSDPA